MKPSPSNDVPATRRSDTLPVADASPAMPWLHTWRAVYLFVLGCFVLWVVLLAVFGWLWA